MLAAIVLSMTVLFASLAPTLQAQSSSATNSQPSATPVSKDDGLRAACFEAVEELRAARKLIDSQGLRIELGDEMLAIERQISAGLKNIRTLDAAEKEQLRQALGAKDRVIAAYEAEIVVLKKQRTSFWKKAELVVIGVAVGIGVAFVMKK